eukprot:TRINITY_DN5558_c0_g1_i1.p2 TRINITY_DN5558_c0_g1~~TRINITY_DN5558_c0_g1_i1.p2  ORF type:complete len:340 (+),score=108.14 TRINITY_DN5558_c0_g1_i1:72-1022(+)
MAAESADTAAAGPGDRWAASAEQRRSRTPPEGLPADPLAWHGRAAAEVGADWDPPRLAAASAAEARPGYQAFSASEYLDSKATLQLKAREVARMLRRSKAVVAYTGAGISTAAGVGDYASKAEGSVAPHRRGTGGPSGSRLAAAPTYGHHFLAALEEKGMLHHWLQQNHDRLAQKAGYPQAKLNEIHGAWGDDKNQVKMMDDTLREDLLRWALQWEEHVDVCLALGTSLCGMNADRIATAAAERGGLIIIGLQRTHYDERCTVRIWGVLDDVLRAIAQELKLTVPNRAAAARGAEWQRTHPNCKYATPKRRPQDPL